MLQRGFQRFARGRVQVVGRLVQHQKVRPSQHQDQKRHPRPLPSGEHAQGFEHVVPGKEKGRQRAAHLRLGPCGEPPGKRPLRGYRCRQGCPGAGRNSPLPRARRCAPGRYPARRRRRGMRSSVVLPQPLGPMRNARSPRRRWRLTFWNKGTRKPLAISSAISTSCPPPLFR